MRAPSSEKQPKLNDGLQDAVSRIRSKGLSSRRRVVGVKCWIEQFPLLSGKPGRALVMILPTRGCYLAQSKLGGCSMCSFVNANPSCPDLEGLFDAFKASFERKVETEEPLAVKVYSSGSVLDPAEVPPNVLEKMLRYLSLKEFVEEVTLESLPCFVTDERLQAISEWISPDRIEIAIGLETASNDIRINMINKPFNWSDFQKAVEIILDKGMHAKAYVLVKPPFLSEQRALDDGEETGKRAIDIGVETLSLNLTTVMKYSYAEHMFKRRDYRPPWLWTGVELCQRLKSYSSPTRIVCCPSGSGNPRVPHNCGKCDSDVVNALREFSDNQDLSHLVALSCNCRDEYAVFLIADEISGTGGALHVPFLQ